MSPLIDKDGNAIQIKLLTEAVRNIQTASAFYAERSPHTLQLMHIARKLQSEIDVLTKEI